MPKRLTIGSVIVVALGLSLLLGFAAVRRTPSASSSWRGADVPTALERLGYAPEDAVHLERLTAYNRTVLQTDSDPATASCGPNRPNQLALSRDLFFDGEGHKHLCGEKVLLLVIDPDTRKVEQKQERIIWDTMHARFERTGDVFMKRASGARDWGVKAGVIVFLDEAVQVASAQ